MCYYRKKLDLIIRLYLYFNEKAAVISKVMVGFKIGVPYIAPSLCLFVPKNENYLFSFYQMTKNRY